MYKWNHALCIFMKLDFSFSKMSMTPSMSKFIALPPSL